MAKKKQAQVIFDPNIALCYVRQSVTRDGEDTNSPDRQKANIEAVCEQHGWIPEWYEDAEGHKSGRSIKNRPGWLALKDRLGDPDVVALVANDLARLHRKGWRVGDMLEQLERNNITLVLAAPGREIDTSTPLGKISFNSPLCLTNTTRKTSPSVPRTVSRFAKPKEKLLVLPLLAQFEATMGS